MLSQKDNYLMKEVRNMKFKTITTILLTSVFLFACDDETTSNNITENDSDSSAVEIEKNPSVSLPVDIFVNSDYDKFAGEKIIFTRSITSVSITDFAGSVAKF